MRVWLSKICILGRIISVMQLLSARIRVSPLSRWEMMQLACLHSLPLLTWIEKDSSETPYSLNTQREDSRAHKLIKRHCRSVLIVKTSWNLFNYNFNCVNSFPLGLCVIDELVQLAIKLALACWSHSPTDLSLNIGKWNNYEFQTLDTAWLSLKCKK